MVFVVLLKIISVPLFLLMDSKLFQLSLVTSLRATLSLYRYSTLFLSLITLLRGVVLLSHFLG